MKMVEEIKMKTKVPFDDETIKNIKVGQKLLLNGTIYVARDAAHKKMIESLNNTNQLPFDIKGQVIYYMGPSPAKPGKVIGAAGPTTSGRMDQYTPKLLELGLKGMIGKGIRSNEVKDAIIKHKALYLGAIGGGGALLAKCIKKSEIIAYEELGPEALRKLEVEDLPVWVIHDIYGGDLYKEGKEKYKEWH